MCWATTRGLPRLPSSFVRYPFLGIFSSLEGSATRHALYLHFAWCETPFVPMYFVIVPIRSSNYP